MKRVVITGIGIVSCLGNNQEEVYQSLINSKSGITFCDEYKEYNLKSQVHGKPKLKLEDQQQLLDNANNYIDNLTYYSTSSVAPIIRDWHAERYIPLFKMFFRC